MQRGFSAIIIVAIAPILILLVVLAIVLSKKTDQKPLPVPSASVIALKSVSPFTNTPRASVGKTIPKQSTIPGQRFTGDGFAMIYPLDWHIESSSSASLQTSEIMPNNSSGDYPSITVVVFPKSVGLASDTALAYKQLQFSVLPLQVANMPATEYRGTVSTKIVDGKVTKSPVQTGAVILNTDTKLFILSYQYDGPDKNTAVDTAFANLLSSFTVN